MGAAQPAAIGEFEQMILLAILQTKEDAYGVTIYEELARHTPRPVARGAVYMTLDRLEKKGLLKSTLSTPTAERGGRAKRCYSLTTSAVHALKTSRRTLLSLWNGLEPILEK
jgi:PadR family transcriptional regulator, regulatory protein PadR